MWTTHQACELKNSRPLTIPGDGPMFLLIQLLKVFNHSMVPKREQLKRVERLWPDKWLKSMPGYGGDWLVCADFARRAHVPPHSTPRSLQPLHGTIHPILDLYPSDIRFFSVYFLAIIFRGRALLLSKDDGSVPQTKYVNLK